MKTRARAHRIDLAVVTVVGLLSLLAGCSASESPEEPESVSAEDVEHLVLRVLDPNASVGERAELVSGSDGLEAQFGFLDAVVAQADSPLEATAVDVESLGDAAADALVTVRLSEVPGVREAVTVGEWVFVACRCDEGDVQLTANSFCAAVASIDGPRC